MKATEKPLLDYRQTVREIWRMAREHWHDLFLFASEYTLPQFFDIVHRLLYNPDPRYVETLSRPAFTIRPEWAGPRDCDDKALLLLAWIFARYVVTGETIPARVVTAGRWAGQPHHVYIEAFLDGAWIPLEATYPEKGGLGVRLWPEAFRAVFSEDMKQT